ncbi:MAG: hypothetical protein JWN02_269 [Acidobacteria bacterium]|nr:hypothetical protein [Acidobacteriota bacterium]
MDAAEEREAAGTPQSAQSLLLGVLMLADLAAVVWLAGGLLPAVVFAAFVSFFLLPAVVIVARFGPFRPLPPPLRMVAAIAVVIVLAAPWFFLRKALGSPWLLDVAACVALTLAARKQVTPVLGEFGSLVRRLRWILLLLPLAFAAAWCGWAAHSGGKVHFYGLFVVDFGNLVSVVSLLRASPMLPLSPVSGGGPLNYHWVYFTLPALLGDLFGRQISNANALILCNLLVAGLLTLAVTCVAGANAERTPWATFVVLFAPFTLYFYQFLDARLHLRWLAMPIRNHLLLSPVNSMVTFGNNSMALVLILLALMELERWNAEGQARDLVAGVTALSLVIGYSVTLMLPVVGALLLWTLLGRVRRPVLALAAAAGAGLCAVALFFAIGVLGGESGRHLAVAFDGLAFFRVVLFGMLPLWLLTALAGKPRLTIYGAVIGSAVIIPSFLYLQGSVTGKIDLSMKTGSLLAVVAAPLIAPAFSRLRLLAVAVVILGLVQTSAYLLQFPFYRFTHATTHDTAIPEGYWAALDRIRRGTPEDAVVVDPMTLGTDTAVWTVILAERRVWLPTPYTRTFLIARSDRAAEERIVIWDAARRGDRAAAQRMAAEAGYVISPPGTPPPPFWRPWASANGWNVLQSLISHR